MSTSKKRSYNSDSRQAQARLNRSRILESAKGLFESEGFEKVTIQQIAKGAELSASSIYSLFKSKSGVLQALIDEALPPEQFETLVREAMTEPSPEARMAGSARLCRHIYDAERELIDLIRGAAVLSPELKQLEQEREERRYERQREFVEQMAEREMLVSQLTPKQVRDLLWAFTGRDLYRLLVIERGWSSEEYESWLTDQLCRMLLK